MVSGGQYVMMAGKTLTHKWCVDSLATGNLKYAYLETITYKHLFLIY